MKRLNILTMILLSTAAVLMSRPQTAQAQRDTIRYQNRTGNRTSISGTITAMTKESVTISSGGADSDVKVNNIRSVQFDTEPTEVRRAREAALAGRYRDAINDLKAVPAGDIGRVVVKQDIAFYLAYSAAKLAISGGGDKDAAHQELLNFVRDNSDNFHYYEAAEVIGDLAVSRGKFADAARYYQVLAKSTLPDLKLKAAVLEAGALVSDKRYDEALPRYEQVLSASANDPQILRQQRYALVGKAICLADKDPQQGLALVQKVIAENDPKLDKILFARAYNAQGACHLKLNQPQEALMDYLHTDLLYYQDAQAHAEALFQLYKLWQVANKPDRSAQAKNLLQSRYPGSVWNKVE